ncbi:bifunctional glutamate N-acetyltransferase/amino-acid acetyltransferase ArgJ [Bacillus cytotoxicus]|uniref:Arginine biosynthesis bifunctional protein ArgJ n=1 Tax=Bacillus cytotoxicus (strain DSM 22905 / CIP 110041 / 391-98 / NVH 391-98) TaxID=315749 RepID=A7GSF3_BACCN|nr:MULTISPECIES: bifunctional glutamate N-acetyltransferase/amino-acid acetyltransferase ArgJ [Bacillus cereus group]ABS23061.1 arginine biosynthesis bifunctional protein ArgJ [Bacillus cytotoxicus NVH 391-98]AWC29712.1 bifunctional glutamate N-acetyltransferase/amino-acid acetyltransferase ArgJ [Bacillus cytotoxicus]AWC41843.1 bifunctional glutamate N-acetyltransferase/amino-acid acetyltransferase ArgJ [Bacillus cytotoxicus]AWC45690.1 bifunctional glutamate N-acetyltransferase/amino-acid acety
MIQTDCLIKVQNGSIVSPQGFSAIGIKAGLKKEKKDLGVIVCDVPAICAAVYTTNQIQAAPVQVTKESIGVDGTLQVIIVNSGNANACTGMKGLEDAYEMRALTAKQFSIKESDVAVASTGVIGIHLPMEVIRTGISALVPMKEKEIAESFYEAILTTDLIEKRSSYQFMIEGKKVTISGAAKGSGMIHPNMATMLSFITTDAKIERESLQAALSEVTNRTFNQITVDGDTSTNDMVIVMASGLVETTSIHKNHPEWNKFVIALQNVCEDLAKQIAKDGEGATKLVEVNVCGARTEEEGRQIAKQIVRSSLVKTAMYGEDPNWGRIISAIGQCGIKIEPTTVDIAVQSIAVLRESEPQEFSEEEMEHQLQKDEIIIDVHLHLGEEKGTAWGCDLSYDYVKINACYRT